VAVLPEAVAAASAVVHVVEALVEAAAPEVVAVAALAAVVADNS